MSGITNQLGTQDVGHYSCLCRSWDGDTWCGCDYLNVTKAKMSGKFNGVFILYELDSSPPNVVLKIFSLSAIFLALLLYGWKVLGGVPVMGHFLLVPVWISGLVRAGLAPKWVTQFYPPGFFQ